MVSDAVRAELLGHDRSQLVRTLGVAGVLAAVVAASSAAIEMAGPVPDAFAAVTGSAVVVSGGVLLAGGIAAGVNGARQGGLAASWVLTFSMLSAWLGVYHYDPGRVSSTAAVVLATSVPFAVVTGTVAHVVGRRYRSRIAGDDRELASSPGPVSRALVGSPRDRVWQWFGLAGSLFVVAVAGVSLAGVPGWAFFPVGVVAGAPLAGTVVTLAWLGVAALPGYRDDGLLFSWTVVLGPVAGGLVTAAVTDPFRGSSVLVEAGTVGLYAFGIAVLVGSAGYALGRLLAGLAGSRPPGVPG